MARGDIRLFHAGQFALGKKLFDLSTDVLKLGIVNSTIVPTLTTADPRWGTGGTTNLSANQVALGTAYPGPITLAGVTFTIPAATGIPTLRATNFSIAQDAAAGFTTAAYGILYDDTDTGKRAIGYVDLNGPVGNTTGPIDFDWFGATDDVLVLPGS